MMRTHKLMRWIPAVLLALCLPATVWAGALAASTTYTLELWKMNSDGTTTLVSTKSVTSDSSGKITFSFSNVPTNATNNFLIVNVKDSAGTLQIKSLVPAPPAGSNNTLGVNTTTTKQAVLLEKLGAAIGTDDPIAVAFGLMFTRNPNLATSDINNFATIGKAAIIGGGSGTTAYGKEKYMLNNGATAADLTAFKKKLVYNAATGTKDLRTFAALTKSAVDTPAQAKADMNKASAMMADIFVDAADAAGIDLNLILAGFDAADPGSLPASSGATAALGNLTTPFKNSMNGAATTFFTRLAALKVRRSYLAALTALNATSAEKTRFNNAVTKMTDAMSKADALFAPYFDGTYDQTETLQAAFNAAHLSSTATTGAEGVINAGITAGKLTAATSTVGDAMDYVYTQAFNSFSTAVQSTNVEISTMQNNVSTALGGTPTSSQLAANGVGTYRDFNGKTVNWPIPQTVAVDFVATAINNGGGLTYNRTAVASAIPVPANMSWLNGTGTRTTNFNTGNTSFENLLKLQEDIQIAEFTRFYIWDPSNTTTSGHPTRAQEQTAKQAFISNLKTIVNNLGGTTDGTTAITTAQKKALVLAQQQPSLY